MRALPWLVATLLFSVDVAVGGTSCDPAEKVGIERFLTDGFDVSAVWTGTEYAVVWIEGSQFEIGEPNEVWFQRLSIDGSPLAEPVLVTMNLAPIFQHWHGTARAMVWPFEMQSQRPSILFPSMVKGCR